MIANLLLSPPVFLLLKISNHIFLVGLSVFIHLYILSLMNHLNRPKNRFYILLPSRTFSGPTPEFGLFPSTIAELVSNRIHLNRLLGLSNLLY